MADMPLVQAHIADMAVDIDASALLIYRAAWTRDVQQTRVTREAAMAKLYATEAAQKVIDQAVQIWGGLGVTSGVMVERSEEHTSELQSLMRISYAVFCL